MWHKFEKIDARGRLPKMSMNLHSYYAGDWSLYECGKMKAMVGVLPSGKIVDDFKAPECEPYFVLTFDFSVDIVTDGEEYARVYNKTKNAFCHFAGQECELTAKPLPDGLHSNANFTTRDARIIKVLIKAYIEASDVA